MKIDLILFFFSINWKIINQRNQQVRYDFLDEIEKSFEISNFEMKADSKFQNETDRGCRKCMAILPYWWAGCNQKERLLSATCEWEHSLDTLGTTSRGTIKLYRRKVAHNAELIKITLENSLGSMSGMHIGDLVVRDHQRWSGTRYCFLLQYHHLRQLLRWSL